MKVWLDDVRDMPAEFDCHARAAAEAIRLLSNRTVVEISLDHDLGEPSNGTGYEVAKWIEQMAFAWSQDHSAGLPPLRWSIHSQNPVGVANMIQALRNADRFWTMQRDLDAEEDA
jgi:hypothetical protein